MRLKTVLVLVLIAGCDQGAPPFDELPLRDTLRAEPEVIASLPESARIRLAARLEAARMSDGAVDEFSANQATGTAALVVALDRVRQRRQGEPLMVGVVGDGAGWPIGDCASPSHLPVLPPIGGAPATATASMETQALETGAGAALRCLFAAAGASHLIRVVGWPAGAVAIDDTVYVNAAWLVSLARGGEEKMDGGAGDGSNSTGGNVAGGNVAGGNVAGGRSSLLSGDSAQDPDGTAPAPGIDTRARILSGALTAANRGDAGVTPQPSGQDPGQNPQAPPVGDAVDACAECASACDTSSEDSCDSSADSGGDSCDTSSADDGSSADSCNSASSDGSDPCSAGSADGGDEAANCQISRGRGHKSYGTRLWLLAPLAFLLFRRRS
jgi:hypothetical protein